MDIRKTIYGLAALASMYGSIASFNHSSRLSDAAQDIRNTPNVQMVQSLHRELDTHIKGTLSNKQDYAGLAKVCLELDSLQRVGAFEQIKRAKERAKDIGSSMNVYAVISLSLGFASLLLAGISLGYGRIRGEDGAWTFERRKKENQGK